MSLSDREIISMIRLAVFIQSKRVTDGETNGIGVAYTALSIASRGKNSHPFPLSSTHFLWNKTILFLDLLRVRPMPKSSVLGSVDA